MADNPAKRLLVNQALFRLTGGVLDAGTIYLASIDDTEFADYSSIANVEANQTKVLACMIYESVLKGVLVDVAPNFAKRYADLSDPVKVNREAADWTYLFELPTDYIAMVAQLDEGDRSERYDHELITFADYAHVVKGTDDQAYYCSLAHTAAAANKPITGASYATNWTLYNTDDDFGEDWATGYAYKADGDATLLATDSLGNSDGDSAYIQYLAYTQAGFADKPGIYPESFAEAFITKLAAEMAINSKEFSIRRALLDEYESLFKPKAKAMNQRPKYKDPHVTVAQARLK